jgi:hypothetical protein
MAHRKERMGLRTPANLGQEVLAKLHISPDAGPGDLHYLLSIESHATFQRRIISADRGHGS